MTTTLAKPVRIARGFDERGLDPAVVVQVPVPSPGPGPTPRVAAWAAAPAAVAASMAAPLVDAAELPLRGAAGPASVVGPGMAGQAQSDAVRRKGLVLVTALKLLVGLLGLSVAALLAWRLLGEPTAPMARQWIGAAQQERTP